MRFDERSCLFRFYTFDGLNYLLTTCFMRFPVLLILILLTKSSFSQYTSFVWVDYVKSEGRDIFNDLVIDQNNNVYAVGYFDENIVIGTDTFYVGASGNDDVMFVKYDELGNLLWAKQLGGTGPQEVYDIVISNNNEIYISGQIVGLSYMGDINGVPQYLTSSGTFRSYLSKFDTDGNLIWTRLMDCPSSETNWLWSIALDQNNNIAAAGTFTGSIDFGNGVQLVSSHQQDVFIAKYNSSGNCFWAMSEGGYNAEWVYDIDFDSNNNFAIVGAFDDTMNLSGNILIPNGDGDAYVAYYNASGVLQWYYQAGGGQTGVVTPDAAENVVFDSNDDIWVSGFYEDTIIFDQDTLYPITINGGTDIFLVKFDNAGNLLHTKRMGYPGNAYGDKLTDMKVDLENSLYVSGAVANNFEIDDSLYFSNGHSDVMISKFDSNGVLKWLKQGGGSNYGEAANAIVVNAGKEVFFCGGISTGPTLVFDTVVFTQNHLEYWFSGIVGKLSWQNNETTGISEMASGQVFVYPNPSRGKVWLSDDKYKTYTLYNSIGSFIRSSSISANLIDLSDLSEGVYFIDLLDASGEKHYRTTVIIQ